MSQFVKGMKVVTLEDIPDAEGKLSKFMEGVIVDLFDEESNILVGDTEIVVNGVIWRVNRNNDLTDYK